MDIKEKHWEKLFADLTTESTPRYGIWKIYSSTKELLKSSKGVRILRANEEKTVITHTNQFTSSDGSTQEKQWQIEKNTCKQPDGLLHPAESSKRALSLLGNGTSAWVPRRFELGRRFSIELFLRHEDWKNSIGSIYDESGCLEKILHIREHLGSFPDTTEETVIELPGEWSGKKEYMTPDLKVSPPEYTQKLVLDPTSGKNETFFLPDSIILNIPKVLKVGEEFEVVAGKLVSNKTYQRLTARYDSSGRFMMLISEVFCLEGDGVRNQSNAARYPVVASPQR